MATDEFPLNAIIIDVDAKAADNLEQILVDFEFVRICAIFDQYEQVLKFVNKDHVDLVFLDIQPLIEIGLSFLVDLVNGLNSAIAVVFMSGRNEMSLNGALRLAGFYFLEKPVKKDYLEDILLKIHTDHASGSAKEKATSMIEKISF